MLSGRRGRITWREIKADPESFIVSRFLLKTKLENPTRMSLKDVTAYWKHWVLQDKKGDPFSFSLDDNSDQGAGGSGKGDGGSGKDDGGSDKGDGDSDKSDGNGDKEDGDKIDIDKYAEKLTVFSLDLYAIDDGIPLPLLCNTPSARTHCLQKLVSNRSQTNKTFHELVEIVDTIEVSPYVKYIASII